MAEPLKNQFGEQVPRKIAAMITSVYRDFDHDAFIKNTLAGYEPLNLMARGRKIAHTMHQFLPPDFEKATGILIDSIEAEPDNHQDSGSLASFLYLPHTNFVSEYGLAHFETSMHALYLLTQKFTAEFSIRPFLDQHTQETLARLTKWATDPNVHVRRLVSEGTRPRLPWASRLKSFQENPRPVLTLLEMLKDDPEIYVRRSVANNLNDIGKDHPDILLETARRWMKNASDNRRQLIRHALRSAVKSGDQGALALLGFGQKPEVSINKKVISPDDPEIGKSVTFSCEIQNTQSYSQRILVDFRIHYMKANGRQSPKVFKLKTVEPAPKACVQLAKTVSLSDLTTRKHHPGEHIIELLLNGTPVLLGRFQLRQAKQPI